MTNCVDKRKRTGDNGRVLRDRRKGRSDAPNFPPETRIPVKTSLATNIEKIGPKTAQKYLENQTRNRPLNKRTVDKYASAMNAGAWELTHQGIAFDKDGKLFDGQHRMAAIVQSGKTIEFSVSRYASTDNAPMIVVDSGQGRNAGDRLVIGGVVDSHGRMIYSILRGMRAIEAGIWSTDVLHSHEARMIYEAESKSVDFVLAAFGAAHTKQWNSAVRAAFAYCYAFAPKECAELAVLLKEKSGIKKGSAAQAFVNAIAEGRIGVAQGNNRIDPFAKCLWLIRQHIEGKQVERVKATASVFNWAKRQRQLANVPTIVEVLA